VASGNGVCAAEAEVEGSIAPGGRRGRGGLRRPRRAGLRPAPAEYWGGTPLVLGSLAPSVLRMALERLTAVFSASANGRRAGVIVCGVDGSGASREGLRTADWLSDRLGLPLVAAHVVTPHPARTEPWAPPSASASVEDIAAGEDLLRQECDDAGVEGAERQVLVGRPAERLAELADLLDAELVVVGSRGQRPHQAALVGSVSSELLGLAPCPVLVYPAQAMDWAWDENVAQHG
jgi:nucleotide-binding universal stress UspA family protein